LIEVFLFVKFRLIKYSKMMNLRLP